MIKVEIVDQYTPEIAAAIGLLMKSLSAEAKGEPMDEQMLRAIIASDWHDQFIATDENGKIVGTATMNFMFAPFAGRIAYLEEIVIDANTQGQGIGSKLWEAIVDWSRQKGADHLEFTSNPKREQAIKFYQKHGATIYPTNFFIVEL
jgi:GNAT superfamily N-acetyltransferase